MSTTKKENLGIHSTEMVREKVIPGSSFPTPAKPTLPSAESLKGSQLIAFGDRITYTFTLGGEVHSLHFDKARREIFLKGHNIQNMALDSIQLQLLKDFKKILASSNQGQPFLKEYEELLKKVHS
ncbi:MAG: hypothetical protein Q7S98_06865 [Deltaproteobacteria bacterium]|nr:hypothetical protein [Deltaproteobacteria bacterium]